MKVHYIEVLLYIYSEIFLLLKMWKPDNFNSEFKNTNIDSH